MSDGGGSQGLEVGLGVVQARLESLQSQQEDDVGLGEKGERWRRYD